MVAVIEYFEGLSTAALEGMAYVVAYVVQIVYVDCVIDAFLDRDTTRVLESQGNYDEYDFRETNGSTMMRDGGTNSVKLSLLFSSLSNYKKEYWTETGISTAFPSSMSPFSCRSPKATSRRLYLYPSSSASVWENRLLLHLHYNVFQIVVSFIKSYN